MKKAIKLHLLNLLMITLGVAIYAFGFVKFNMANQLAQGGFSGIALIVHSLGHINPAFTSLLLNIPLLFIGYRYLGRRVFFYTIYGSVGVSFFIWLFQLIPLTVDIDNDPLIAALLAGVFAGAGLGLVFKFGGTTGGSDIVARLMQQKKGIPISRTFITIDMLVLTASLTYIDLGHMMYTVIASFVVSQVLELVQSGGYTVRGMQIISSNPDRIAKTIQVELGRGVTYLNGEGVFSGKEKKILYVVLNPREIQDVKSILAEYDPDAFVTIMNVHEVIGDFNYSRSRFIQKKK